MEEAPQNHPSATSQRYSDTGATLVRAHASAKKTKDVLITPLELAAAPIDELVCHKKTGTQSPIETAILPTAFEFNLVKMAAQAEKKLKSADAMGYEVSVPCCACMNCVIVRVFNHGRMYDESYNCVMTKRQVDKYGHCKNGKEGQGPNVIVVNPRLDLLAERTSSGELKEFPHPTEIPDFDIKDMQSQPKLKPTKKEEAK